MLSNIYFKLDSLSRLPIISYLSLGEPHGPCQMNSKFDVRIREQVGIASNPKKTPLAIEISFPTTPITDQVNSLFSVPDSLPGAFPLDGSNAMHWDEMLFS